MAVPCFSYHYVLSTLNNAPTSRAVEIMISRQIQTRRSAPTLKPQSHVESAASRSPRTCWCSFLFPSSPPWHPAETERPWLLASGSSSHLEDHALAPGPGTKWPQGPRVGSAGEVGSEALLAALHCGLFPLLAGRGVPRYKLWGCSP